MSRESNSRWANLQANAHLPEVQAVIRREIFQRSIRVVPAVRGGIRIIPTNGTRSAEESEPSEAVGFGPDVQHRREPFLRIERIT